MRFASLKARYRKEYAELAAEARDRESFRGSGGQALRNRDRHRSLVLAHLEEASRPNNILFAAPESADRADQYPN